MAGKDQNVRFIRKDGRIIPIRTATVGVGATAAKFTGHAIKSKKLLRAGRVVSNAERVAHSVKAYKKHRELSKHQFQVRGNKSWDAAGLGISIASGAVAAATFGLGMKGFIAGEVGSKSLDAASIAANLRGVKGKGHLKERAVLAAKREARNTLIGNAVYGAGILAFKSNRQAAVGYAKKAAGAAKKILGLAKKFGVLSIE